MTTHPLPSGIGAPATRALEAAGWTTLEQVAGHTRADLLALHGVGPKAVRVLAEALDAHGLALAG
jgi:predicted flap endonuclease-1-like 5' DNA nuclease